MTSELQLEKTHKLAGELKALVEEIKELHGAAALDVAKAIPHCQDFLAKASKIGEALLRIKAIVPAVDFLDVVTLRIGLHERTAQRYMDRYRKGLLGDLPSPEAALQLTFEALDFVPKASGPQTPKTTRTGGSGLPVLRHLSGLWDFIEKRPVPSWEPAEKDQFAEDTARRMKLCEENKIKIPTIIELPPSSL